VAAKNGDKTMNKMCYGFCLGATALAWAWSGISTPVHAQGAPASGPIPAFDSITAFGQQMGQAGIYFNLGYTEDFSRLVAGTPKVGTSPIGHANAGVTFDLERLIGIPEASVHVIFEERNGRSNAGGTDIGLNQNAGPVKYRLVQFYWEQGFLNDQIDIQVGRTEPTLEFAVSDLSCTSVTGIFCAQPGTWYSQNVNKAYPASEWGGRINLAVTPQIYFKVGAYEDTTLSNGFLPAGFDWRTSGSTGVFIPAEVGYLTGFGSARLPSKYDVGFWYDTSQYTVGNQPGNPTVTGRQGGYIQLQQTVWRPDPKTNQSLTLFGGAIWYNNSPAYTGQYYAGLYDRAPWGASRPLDSIGLYGTMATINQSDTACSPINCTGTPHRGAPFDKTFLFEVNYGIGIVPGVTAKPYAAWSVQPFTQANPAARVENGVALGVEFTVVFEQLFNFPVFIPH
jgi:porin